MVQIPMSPGTPYGPDPAAELASLRSRLNAAEELLQQSQMDALTGLHNKEALRKQLESRISAAESGQAQPGLIFIDLVLFKRINDTFGHDVGDSMLTQVAATIKNSLRQESEEPSDVVAHERLIQPAAEPFTGRTGGDEFTLLVDLTPRQTDTKSDAHERLQVVELRVRDELQAFFDSLPPEMQKLGFNASIGVALWRPGMSATELLQAADKAMYADKQANVERRHRELPLRKRLAKEIGTRMLRYAGIER